MTSSDQLVVTVTRISPTTGTDLQSLSVDIYPDGAALLVLDDGETVELEPAEAVRLALAILSPLAHRKAA